jgi:hypothetical protein
MLVKKPKGRDYLTDLETDVRKILWCTFNRVRGWIQVAQDKDHWLSVTNLKVP